MSSRRHSAPAAGTARATVAWGWGVALLPALVVLGYVCGLPLLLLGWNSVHPSLGPAQVGTGFTAENYLRFFGDSLYWGVMADTMLMALVVVLSCAVLGYPLAYTLARSTSKWRGVITFTVLSPLLISAIIRNLGWIPALGRNGFVNKTLLQLKLIDEPLALLYNFTGVAIGLTHALLPFMVLSLLTVIRRIDIDLEEAARGLGAGRLTTFFRVLLPLSREGLLGGSLLVFSLSISGFTTIAMMGGKRVLLLSTLIEQQVRSTLDYPFGATVAMVLLALTLAFTLVSLRLLGRVR